MSVSNHVAVAGSAPVASKDIFIDFFKQLKACYPSWRSSIRSKDEDASFKRQWLKAFAENGVDSEDKLALGLKQARADRSSWLPSVGQFVEWCKPTAESLGLPDVRSAYIEAAHHQAGDVWSNPAVYFACKGWLFDLQRYSEHVGFKIFKQKYDFVLEKMINGEEFEGVPCALPSPDEVSKKVVPMPDGFISDCFKSV